MHVVMMSEPTCKTLLLPLRALKPRKGLQFAALRKMLFVFSVREMHPQHVLEVPNY